jgi:hypothetical protein
LKDWLVKDKTPKMGNRMGKGRKCGKIETSDLATLQNQKILKPQATSPEAHDTNNTGSEEEGQTRGPTRPGLRLNVSAEAAAAMHTSFPFLRQ